MAPLLFRIAMAAVLSVGSLIVILFRLSPLVSPELAIPLFYVTLFLSLSSGGALAAYAAWVRVPTEGMDSGRKVTVALREGIFLGLATVFLLTFHLLGILTWWIAILIYLVFVLIEIALQS